MQDKRRRIHTEVFSATGFYLYSGFLLWVLRPHPRQRGTPGLCSGVPLWCRRWDSKSEPDWRVQDKRRSIHTEVFSATGLYLYSGFLLWVLRPHPRQRGTPGLCSGVPLWCRRWDSKSEPDWRVQDKRRSIHTEVFSATGLYLYSGFLLWVLRPHPRQRGTPGLCSGVHFGAEGGTRTHTWSPILDFESSASANSTTSARTKPFYHLKTENATGSGTGTGSSRN